MDKLIAEEKARAGLWHAVASPNVTGRTEEKMAQSKRARAGSLAIVNYLQEVVARTCILQENLVLPFSAVTFVLLGFVFVVLPFVKSFLVLPYGCAPTATHSYLPNNCLRLFSFSFIPFFISLEISLFLDWRPFLVLSMLELTGIIVGESAVL